MAATATRGGSGRVGLCRGQSRRLAARRTAEALDHFERLPNIKASSVEGAKETFARWEREAVESLRELNRNVGRDRDELQRRQAEALSRVASTDALHDLLEIGLLPEMMAQRAAQAIGAEVSEHPGGE